MNETFSLALAFVAGILLGAFFFGGLWWTIRKGVSSQQPALWMFGSLLVRTAIALSGFYIVGRGDWKKLVACLVGFVFGRLSVTWLTRAPEENQTRPAQEASHAP